MQSRILSFFALLLGMAVLSSCSKTNKEGRHIPKTAAVVVQFDGKSMNEKLPWSEVKTNELYKKLISDTNTNAFQRSMMEDPAVSGVKPDADMRMFIIKDSTAPYTAVEGSIGDEAKFKAFLAQSIKDGKESKKGDHTYWTTDRFSVAYSKDHFLAAIHSPEMDFQKTSAMARVPQYDSAGNMIYSPRDQEVDQMLKRDMTVIVNKLIDLKEDESLAKDERFTKLMKEDGDISFWYAPQYMMDQSALGMLGIFGGVTKMVDGNVSAGVVNFTDGKITMDAWAWAGKDLDKLYDKYEGSAVDKDMIKNIPSNNIAGYFAMNFKPEGLKALMQMMGVDGMANMGLAQFGFTIDDFVKANKGDIFFAVSDLTLDTARDMMPSMLFGASVGDKNTFNKLINAGKLLMAKGNGPKNVAYAVNDKYFGISDQKATVDTWLKGGAKSTSRAVSDIPSTPFAGYVDLKYILNFVSQQPKMDSLSAEMMRVSRDFWDNISVKGGEYKGGAITAHYEINLIDTKMNSLKQLNTYISRIGAMAMEKKKRDEVNFQDWYNQQDTATVVMAPDTLVGGK